MLNFFTSHASATACARRRPDAPGDDLVDLARAEELERGERPAHC
ncbi:hypothetical protein [Streptomyces sp. NPDC088270]